ncbi:MAG: O-antigen ligase family protein, partial [Leptospirales bacterium]
VNLNTAAMLFEVFLFLAACHFLESKRKIARIAPGIFIVLAAILIILFESRGAYGGILAGAGVWALMGLTRRVSRNPFVRTAGIVLGAALILTIAVWILLEYYLHVIGKERAVLWSISTAGILENPWRTLFGYGTFGPYFLFQHSAGPISADYLQSLPGWFWTTHPHSEYLSLFYGLGLAGLLAHMALTFSLIFMADSAALSDPAKRRAGGAILGATVAISFHGVVDPIAITIVTGLLFWILLAEATALQADRQPGSATPPANATPRLWPRVAGCLLFLGLAVGLTRSEIREGYLLGVLLPHWQAPGATQEYDPQDTRILSDAFDEYYRFLNRWSFSDESYRLYAEMNYATLRNRFAAGDDRAYRKEINKIEAAYCEAIRLRDYPLYYRRIRLILEEQQSPPRTICGQDPEDFYRAERARDPHSILDSETAPLS